MEELSHIFKEIEIKDHNLRLNTHHVLKVMIKATFKDDEEKTRELLTMITQGLNKEDYSKLSIFERMAEEIRVKDEINDNNINIIFNKNNEISDLHEELSNLRKENEELKLQLKNQNTGG